MLKCGCEESRVFHASGIFFGELASTWTAAPLSDHCAGDRMDEFLVIRTVLSPAPNLFYIPRPRTQYDVRLSSVQ